MQEQEKKNIYVSKTTLMRFHKSVFVEKKINKINVSMWKDML